MTEDEMVRLASVDMSLSYFQEILEDRMERHAMVHRVTKSQTRLSD